MGRVGSMQFDYTHTYATTPDKVVDLMRTEEFIDDVATHAGAVSHTVAVGPEKTLLAMKLPVPENLAKFVGSSIKINQTFHFEAPRPDGVINGTVTVDVVGMPVDVNAQAEMLPKDGATEGRYTGDLLVKIPLVGKKVEAQVEPFIRNAFAGLERRAADWLSR